MDEFLYLEADEEITSVIDKLKGLENDSIGLVVPKGSMIAQSLVSLKLLQKEAARLHKDIAIVTSDEVGRNLAAQLGLTVYADVRSRTPLSGAPAKKEAVEEPIEIDMGKEEQAPPVEQSQEKEASQEDLPQKFSVHRYDEERKVEEPKKTEPAKERPREKAPEIVPKAAPPEEETFRHHVVGDEPSAAAGASERVELEAARPVSAQVHPAVKPQSRRRNLKPLIFFIGSIIILLLILVAVDLAIAKLEVKLSVAAEVIEKEVTVSAERDKNADYENGIISAAQVQKEETVEKTVEATGEKDVGEAARGNLTFKNESGVEETVAAGTTVESSGGVEFTLDGEIKVPKAELNSAGDKVLGQVTGAVTAKSPGSAGNLPASTTYVISGKSKLSATGVTSGGVTKKVKVVSKSDLENAKKRLEEEKTAEINSSLTQGKGDIFFTEAARVELNDFSSNKSVGDETDQFVAKGKVKYTNLVFKESEFQQAVVKQTEKALPADKGLLLTEGDIISPTLDSSDINIGRIAVKGKLKSHIGPKIDIPALTNSWRLKPIKKVRDSARGINGATVDTVELSPQYALPIAPYFAKNIKITLEYQKK